MHDYTTLSPTKVTEIYKSKCRDNLIKYVNFLVDYHNERNSKKWHVNKEERVKFILHILYHIDYHYDFGKQGEIKKGTYYWLNEKFIDFTIENNLYK